MSFYIILAGVVAFFILKKFFIKIYPFFTNKKIGGLFILPLLLLVYMAITLIVTIPMEPLNSTNVYKSTGLLVEFKGGQKRMEYEAFLSIYKTATEFFFFVVLCCSSFSIYKVFDLNTIRSSWIKLIMGIASVACIICYLVNIMYLSKLDNYLSITSLGEYWPSLLPVMWVSLIVVLVALIITWHYFSKSLNLVTSIKVEEAETNIINTTIEDTSRSKTEVLIDLKSLLDSGILTQEEFDAQKKEILNS